MAGWTTNLLAIGLVLVIAVGLGRQLVEWYGLDAVPTPGPIELPLGALDPNDSGAQPPRLEFGDQGYSLVRDTLVGDREAAVAKLRERCRTLLESAGEPTRAPGQSELRFLEQSAGRAPLEQQAGRWEIHQFEGDFPLLVAIRTQPPAANPSLAEPARRVLAWGLVVPADERTWNLYLYQAAGTATDAAAVARRLPLPAGCRRTLSLVGNRGESTIGIAGSAAVQTWVQEFDRGYQQLGWKSRGWRVAGGVWQARYDSPRAIEGHVEVRFHEAERGRLTGLILALPGADAAERGDP